MPPTLLTYRLNCATGLTWGATHLACGSRAIIGLKFASDSSSSGYGNAHHVATTGAVACVVNGLLQMIILFFDAA